MNLSSEQENRAAGVLLASAAGDALGAGYEFTYPAPTDAITMIGGGPFGFVLQDAPEHLGTPPQLRWGLRDHRR